MYEGFLLVIMTTIDWVSPVLARHCPLMAPRLCVCVFWPDFFPNLGPAGYICICICIFIVFSWHQYRLRPKSLQIQILQWHKKWFMAPRLCVCVFRPDFFPNLSTRERNIDTSAINIHWSSNHRCCRFCGQKEILTETSTAGNYRDSQQGPDFHKDLSRIQWNTMKIQI